MFCVDAVLVVIVIELVILCRIEVTKLAKQQLVFLAREITEKNGVDFLNKIQFF